MHTAIIVGGAECVHDDLKAARALCEQAGVKPAFFYVNDMIPSFPDSGYAVTLHPDKLQNWLNRRRAAALPKPIELWAHRPHKLVSHTTKDIGGSSGLFAAKIARERLSANRIILTGVPLDVKANHFVRHQPWNAAMAFRKAWTKHQKEFAPIVRSMSGWTKIMFGAPTVEWLQQTSPPKAEKTDDPVKSSGPVPPQ